ncbi:hypothetical protein DPM19_13285 [Actinomadura craniellae]|uniref:Zinc-finger domain-containing protein n=1 Tax=Actinomadura craniellae TaxID=2231787 RepID=A0A365H6V5_9ACTN|nr:hypothetical protein [Actinomadura craniellae]RAY14716.1 hypothetical protein DPM19_13285 [Actinomadura craniellae]
MNPAHLDYDTLAELAEGLLDHEHAASANEHLDDCAECRERSAELADVSRILAEAPAPDMPADLAARLDAAIMAEAMSSSTVTSLTHRRAGRRWQILSVAAASVVAIGGGVLIGGAVLKGADSPEGTAQATPPRVADPTDRGASEGALSSRSDRSGYPVLRSGTDYRSGTLAERLRAGLASPPPPGGGAAPAELAGCVSAVAGNRQPYLVEVARYEGAPATLVLLPAGEGRFDVVVAGPGCAAGRPDVVQRLQISR